VLVENSTLSGNLTIYGGLGIEGNCGAARLLAVTEVTSRPPQSIAGADGGFQPFDAVTDIPNPSGYLQINTYVGYPCEMTYSDASSSLFASGDCVGDGGIVKPLSDNGGETETHEVLPFSPARDAWAGEGCPPTDQRGVGRPQAAACDIGAFELEIDTPTYTPSPTPSPSPVPTPTPSATPQVSQGPRGDRTCDERIDAADPLRDLFDIVDIVLPGTCLGPGDADCDGDTDVADVLRLLAFLAGVPKVQPTGCSAIGSWL
jgi:hypothetical protein